MKWISLTSGDLGAQIDPHGAQLSSLTYAETTELMWNGDPAVWSGRAPLLFPIVGALAGGEYRLGDESYALPRHGFARGKNFEVESAAASEAVFVLGADSSTSSVYPFRFELRVEYALSEDTLSVTTRVRNLGTDPMPASFGYHPAFRWPLPFGAPRSSHDMIFDAEEPAPVRRLDGAGLLTPEHHPTPIEGRTLKLTDALFENDVLILDRMASRGVTYGSAYGPRLRIDFPDAAYLGIWTKPGATFVCIEPWHGIADPQGFNGDFRDKPGVFTLGGGEELVTRMRITLTRQGTERD